MNKKGEATKRLIKEKAYLLFAENGFKEVTMKDICESTGLSRGGLYCHYSSTGQIFSEIMNELMNLQDEEFSTKMALQLPAVQILDEVLSRYEDEMIDSSSSLSIAIFEYYSMREMNNEDNAIYKQYNLSKEMWQDLIQYGIDRGEFYPADIQAIFDLIVFSYQGVRLYSKLIPIDREIPRRILKEIRKLLVIPEPEV